jgi:hypothetical protein
VPACAPEIRNAGHGYSSAFAIASPSPRLIARQQIRLVEHEPARLGEQVLAELAELPTMDSASRTGSRVRIDRRDVDQCSSTRVRCSAAGNECRGRRHPPHLR